MNHENVDHATVVGSADTVTAAGHVDMAGRIVVQQTRESKIVKLVWSIVALFAVVAVVLVLLVARSSVGLANSARTSSDRNIDDLRSQLEAQRVALEQTKATGDAKSVCYDLYTSAVTTGNAETLSAMAELFIKAFDVTSPDAEVRRREFTPYVDALRKATAAYRSAAVARDAYAAAGRPLPCPLTKSP